MSTNGRPAVLTVDQVFVTATRDRLYLTDNNGTVLDPQVPHALAMTKQTPPLARFVAHLNRAFTPVYLGFGWGPAADRLPHLPRLRLGRSILSPARWLLTAADLRVTLAAGNPARDRVTSLTPRSRARVILMSMG